MYAVLSIPVYVMSHAGGVRPCQMCVELPGAVEEDEAEAISSPSVDKPLSVDSEGGLGEYGPSLYARSHPAPLSYGYHHWVGSAGTDMKLIK